VLRWYAGKEQDFLKRAATLEELARTIGVPAAKLIATVARWNSFCAQGKDQDFRRGESVWERYKAKHANGHEGINPTLGTIERPPFFAMTINRSIVGTKGGARTNDKGEVLREDNSVIAGLYAAGNVMANPIGTRAVGAGTTIGPCMTWGYICAKSLLAVNR
jgi:3-oxosteroid 1-dehydrogenase